MVIEKHIHDLDDRQKKLLREGNFYIRKTLKGNLKIIFPLTKKDYPKKKDSIKAQGFPWTNSPLFECTTKRIKISSTILLKGNTNV